MLSASDSLLVTLLVAISTSGCRWAGRRPTALPPIGADRRCWRWLPPACADHAGERPELLMMLSVLLWLSFIYGMYNGR